MTLQCHEICSFVLFQVKRCILCTKGTNQSANFLDFLVLGSKFTKFLSFFKQKIGFPSNDTPLFSIMRHNSSVLFQLKFYIVSKKVAYQSTSLVRFHLSSRKSEILVASLCHIKFSLKRYRRLISHDIEQGCKVSGKTDLWFQIRHEEFGEFSPYHLKV